LRISYPNAEDRKRAAKLGVSPGGSILIHGLPKGEGWIGAAHRLYDWTLGCVAVTDEEIDEIFKLVAVGTPVEIRP
jgi:murein L,D-transpeptidase YafK